MSLSTSLSNALSGLTASSRAASLVSNNVANAMTEGYGRREIQLSSRVVSGGGAGVQVDGVMRVVDTVILRDRRLADAGVGFSETRVGFQSNALTRIGSPDEAGSLSGRLRQFEASLIEAAGRPDDTSRLATVLESAQSLASGLRTASDSVQAARLEADGQIAVQVDALNSGLAEVEELNAAIIRLNGAGQDVSALLDQRQIAVDRISEIVPVRDVPRENGSIALITPTGGVLLDGKAPVVSFSPVEFITEDMTLASGALSGLQINGRDIALDGASAPLAGGSLAAQFDVRDNLAVTQQARLDTVARDLVERFAEPGLDPTLAAGAAGLFTDGTGPFDPADEPGLSARIGVNAAADPAQGGELWRLRDGLGAAAPGEAGDSTLLTAYQSQLTALRAPSSGSLGVAARSMDGLFADLAERAGADLAAAERQLGFETARRDTLKDQELASGVDTDQELQKLLLIEQSYAANARVIQVIDDLLQQLSRL